MSYDGTFKDVVSTEEDLREIMGHPSYRVKDKAIDHIDEHCKSFISRSPFVLIASSDGRGNFDISPKGDPPGFVSVLDEKTLAIPDRPGNQRADTFSNIIQNNSVGLIFLIPNVKETLRVSGKATLVRDDWLREQMSVKGKAPDFAMIVTVEEAFLHCAKCVIRSNLWNPDEWPASEGVPSLARTMIDHGQLEDSLEEMEDVIQNDASERLY